MVAPRPVVILVGLAALAIVIGGLREASAFLSPFLLACFIAAATSPFMFWLKRRRVPAKLALLIAIALDVLAIFSVGGLFAGTLPSVTRRLPHYAARVTDLVSSILETLKDRGLPVRQSDIAEIFDPNLFIGFGTAFLRGIGSALSHMTIVLLISAFLLAEAPILVAKFRKIAKEGEHIERVAHGLDDVNRYLEVKSVTSLMTGTLAGLVCVLAGVDFPFLWGALAFLLNFIPTIGSILASFPPVALALLEHGLGTGLLVGGGYLAINFSIGNVWEPRWMGRTLGLSASVVLLSMLFWGWVLGPVGALLSAPLTMIVKFMVSTSPEMGWLSILLGRGDELVEREPAEAPEPS
jgi:AI-2 transport protein TqsA